jgi:hypothetical protein
MPFVPKQRHQLATGSRRNDQRPDKHDRNGHHDQYISPTHGHFLFLLAARSICIRASRTATQAVRCTSLCHSQRRTDQRPTCVVLQKQMRRRPVVTVSRYRGQPSRRRHSCATAACLGRDASWSRSCPNALQPRAGATAANVAARTRHRGERSVAQRPKPAPSWHGGYEMRVSRPTGRGVRTGSKGER